MTSPNVSPTRAAPVVLIVDSNASSLALATQALAKGGYQAIAAPTIEAAEAALNAGTVDLVLIDLHLPEISGNDFVDYLRNAKLVTAPILLWSNLNPVRLAGLVAGCGAAGAIGKDLDMSNLCADLSAFLPRPALPERQP